MRRRFPFILFSLLMVLDIGVFLLQKLASDRAASAGQGYLKSALTHPWLWLSVAVGPLQVWIWTRILARTDISLAFPLTSLSVPLTMITSIWALGERPSMEVWIGAILITIGAAILKPVGHASEEAVQAEIISGT